MKSLILIPCLSVMSFAAAQNLQDPLPLNNAYNNPPAQYTPNQDEPQIQQMANANRQLMNVQARQQVIASSGANPGNVGSRTSALSSSTRNAVSSHHATVSRPAKPTRSDLRFKIRMKKLTERYRPPQHYGNKHRIRRCHRF